MCQNLPEMNKQQYIGKHYSVNLICYHRGRRRYFEKTFKSLEKCLLWLDKVIETRRKKNRQWEHAHVFKVDTMGKELSKTLLFLTFDKL